jgi:hypothetical protein
MDSAPSTLLGAVSSLELTIRVAEDGQIQEANRTGFSYVVSEPPAMPSLKVTEFS